MLVIERRNAIKRMLAESGVISVAVLSQSLGVSETTIRRDLDYLENVNILKKIHGGAIAHDEGAEPLYKERKNTRILEKEQIAKVASSLIHHGDTILLDSGTTTATMIDFLQDKKGMTVVTNSINIAYQLQNNADIQVVMIGGFLRHRTGSVIGSIAVDVLRSIFVDKLFLSCSGICPDGGVTVSNMVSLELRKQMMACAKETVVLADHTKIGQRFLARVAHIHEINYLVTDEGATTEQKEAFEKHGVKVLSHGEEWRGWI